MSKKFTLYDDSKYENHATNELPLASKNIGKKEELSKAFIKPIILDRNKYLNDDNWELGLDYTDFTGSDVQNAFELGWDTAAKEIINQLRQTLSLMSNVHPSIQKHIIDVVESNIIDE